MDSLLRHCPETHQKVEHMVGSWFGIHLEPYTEIVMAYVHSLNTFCIVSIVQNLTGYLLPFFKQLVEA